MTTFDLGGTLDFEMASGSALIATSGGEFTITGANNASLAKGSVLRASGGTITLDAAGSCGIAGKVSVEATGADGGTISISCVGLTLTEAAKIIANGIADAALNGGTGGSIGLDAGTGAFSSAKGTEVSAKGGKGGFGGNVTISAGSACSVGSKINTSSRTAKLSDGEGGFEVLGGDGGTITVACGGDITLPKGAGATAGAAKVAAAGTLTITAGGKVQVDRGVTLRSDGAGDADTIAVTAADSCVVDGRVQAVARLNTAGNIGFICEGFTLGTTGVVRVAATGSEASGVSIDTTGTVNAQPAAACTISGKIKATAKSSVLKSPEGNEPLPATGGTVDLNCGTTLQIDTTASIRTSATGKESIGGTIDLTSAGAQTIDGKLFAAGRLAGGTINGEGCAVTVGATGALKSNGTGSGASGGANTLTAHSVLTVSGMVQALPDGTNTLTYLTNEAVTAANVKPASTPMQDTLLSPCS